MLRIKSISLTFLVLATITACESDRPNQFMDGTNNEITKTNTSWMDAYWTEDGGDGVARFDNVDPRVGPDRRP